MLCPKAKGQKYNDLQRTTQKTQDPATRILQKRWVIHVFQKGEKFLHPLMVSVV